MKYIYIIIAFVLSISIVGAQTGGITDAILFPTMDQMMQFIDTNTGTVDIIVSKVTIKTGSIYEYGKKLPDTSLIREKSILDNINNVRKKDKLKPFFYDSALSMVARNYAKQMRDQKFFNHIDQKGKNAWHRIRLANYAIKLSRWGEVIAQAKNANESFIIMMGSTEHKKIIMSPKYNLIGVGNWKGNTVVLVFYNNKTKLIKTTFALPKGAK